MRGVKDFNGPAFNKAQQALAKRGNYVFNPYEKDCQKWGPEALKSEIGRQEDIPKFNLRYALGNDLKWIASSADAVALLPGWRSSLGATAEAATALALGLKVYELNDEGDLDEPERQELTSLTDLEAAREALRAVGEYPPPDLEAREISAWKAVEELQAELDKDFMEIKNLKLDLEVARFGETTASLVAKEASKGSLPVTEWQGYNLGIGLGGAPTRASILPTDSAERKTYPVGTGVLDYFPDALCEIAHVSWQGNDQHNPGQPLHWNRSKSDDEADTMIRHYLERGKRDKDGARHTAKMAWRALALLQKEIEEEAK